MSTDSTRPSLFKTTLDELYREKRDLDRVISILEDMQNPSNEARNGKVARRRGRKNMGAEERQEVSLRMRQYWERRRQSAPDSRLPSPAPTPRS